MSEDALNNLDDAGLVARAKAGEIQAFGALYERYCTVIFRYIRSKVSDTPLAEDLSEQTFLQAFEKIGHYRERGYPYSAFLYRIARNMLVDHYRARKPEVELDEDHQAARVEDDLEQQAVDEERAGLLRGCLEALPDRYQEVIRLRILLEMSTETAAQWMGKSEGATRVLLHRALKALRIEWERLDDG